MQLHLDIISAFARAHRRSAAWAAGALAVLALFLFVVVPFVASTRIVKERIAFEMSMWSGYRVTIGQNPRIKLFPFRAVLTDVRLGGWSDDAPPVLAAEEVILNLSPLVALVGDIYFYKVRFEGFTLNVQRNGAGGYALRLPGGGMMANAVKDARVLAAGSTETTDLSALAGEPFGRLHFTRGRVVAEDTGEEVVTGLDGALVWPRLDKSGSLIARGVWHGETMEVDIEAAEPMLLLTGGASQTSLSISGAPGSLILDGSLHLSQQPFFTGQATFSTPSLRRMVEWSGADIGPSPKVGSARMESRIQGSRDRIKFEELQLTLDDHAGNGVLELAFDQTRPALSGTLAFKQLNLDSLLSVFTTISVDRAAPPNEVDTTFAERFDLDLRVSATQATAGIFGLADVAATAQIRDGLAVFDISDARAFGGTMQAGLRLDRSAAGTEVETSLRATDMDGGAFGRAVGLSKVVPAARGNVSVLLKGPVQRWDAFTDRLDGSFSAEFGPGTLPGLDLAAFVEKTRQGGFFPLKEVAAGTLAIDGLQLKGGMSNNIVHIERAEVRSGESMAELSGVLSLAGRGLALSGTLHDTGRAASSNLPPVGFFVGGTWSEPFISPATPTTNLE